MEVKEAPSDGFLPSIRGIPAGGGGAASAVAPVAAGGVSASGGGEWAMPTLKLSDGECVARELELASCGA